MPLTVGSTPLTLEDVERVARFRDSVELAPEALVRIRTCRRMLEEKIAGGEIMYGVNTGIGEFSEVALTEDQVQDFQRYLIFNHSAGIGEPVAEEDVRAAILSRVRVHSHGHSGCRPEITETLVAMLNAGITPVVCEKGSVGACGDLAPMSQVALCLLGEGEAFYRGERLRSSEAFERAGIPIPGLRARDGLATINGSNLITGMGSLQLLDAERSLAHAEIACALTLESLRANMTPFDERLHTLRGFPGAVTSARNIRRIMEGSALLTGAVQTRVAVNVPVPVAAWVTRRLVTAAGGGVPYSSAPMSRAEPMGRPSPSMSSSHKPAATGTA